MLRNSALISRALTMASLAFATFLTLFLASCGNAADISRPAMILLIRHAEKPEEGEPLSAHLTARGMERANALQSLFTDGHPPGRFPPPDFIFATKHSEGPNESGDEKSFRPIETVQSFADSKHIVLNSDFANDDYETLAQKLLTDPKYAGKVVLICWHQGKLPKLAAALKATAPDNWKKKVFDRVWQITYDAQRNAKFQDLPQQLLPGDSTH